MAFWLILGFGLIISSVICMVSRHYRGEKHQDNQLTRYLDWPMIVTAILLMVPTWAWWDFIVGLVVMAMWEVWQLLTAKRKLAQHELSSATKSGKGEAA
jgi:hypothetical protein